MTLFNTQTRRQWLQGMGATAAGLGASVALPTLAQAGFPNRPIRLIVPLPAGGATDAAARLFAEQMQRSLGQPVVVDNKPGGLFLPGLQTMASSAADGYTLMHINVSMCATQAAMHKYDMLKQLAPIGKAGETSAILVASAKTGIKSVKELIERAKAQPGKLNYGVGGLGSIEHLFNVMMEKTADFSATVVPFKGGPDGAMAVMQGEIDFQILPAPLVLALLPKGGMTPLASLTASRIPQLPQVLTLAEAGVPLKTFTYWGGFAAVQGTPTAVIDLVRQHIHQAAQVPEVQNKLATMGMSPAISTSSAEFAQLIQGDIERMDAIVKAGNLKFN